MIDDIRIDINIVKASKEDKKVFNDLNILIIDINNNQVKKEDPVKNLEKNMSDLTQLRQEKKTVFQNKMIQVVYQLFNALRFKKKRVYTYL